MKYLVITLMFCSVLYASEQPDSLELDGTGSFKWFTGISTSSHNIIGLNSELFKAGFPVFENKDNYLFDIGLEMALSNFIIGLSFKSDLTHKDRSIDVKRSNLQSTSYGFYFGYKLQPFNFIDVYSIAGIDFEFSKLTLVNDINQGGDINNSIGKITTFNNEGYLFYIGLGIGINSDMTDAEYSHKNLKVIFGNDVKEYDLYIVQKFVLDAAFEVKYVIGIKDEWSFGKNKFDIPGLYPEKFILELKLGFGFINRNYKLPKR